MSIIFTENYDDIQISWTNILQQNLFIKNVLNKILSL